jgi:uncharacterized protein
VRTIHIRTVSAALVAVALAWQPGAAQEPHYPAPTGYVVDEAGLLAPETVAHLTAVCDELDTKTKCQIGVAVVRSIAPLEIEDYAVRLFEQWGVGSQSLDEGVLLVVAEQERRVRIEVGYGLEGILPDGKAGGILRSDVVPHLRQNDWNAGVAGGVVALSKVIAEDRGVTLASLEGNWAPQRPAESRRGRRRSALGAIMPILMAFFLISILSGGRRRRGRASIWPWIFFGGFGGGNFRGGGFGGGGGGFGGFGGGMSGGGGASSGF